MLGPHTLTLIVYACIAVVFVSVIAYMIYYTRRQTAKLKEATARGADPQSVEAEILLAKHQDEKDSQSAKH